MKTYCDLSSELSWWDNSDDRWQYMFLWYNNENYPWIIPVTSSYLEPCQAYHVKIPRQPYYEPQELEGLAQKHFKILSSNEFNTNIVQY